MSKDDYSRGYAAGLRELDHGLSYSEVERMKAENEQLKQERDAFWQMSKERYGELQACRKERLDYQEWIVGSLRENKREIEQLQSDNVKIRKCLEWYGDKKNHDFPETGDYRVSDPLVWEDNGQRARECLSKLGSGSDES